MPLINYVCGCGEVFKKYFKSARDAPSVVGCKCGSEAKKSFGAVSVGHKIVIDNGLMARSVELMSPDIQEVNDQRSQKDYSEED